MPSRLQCPRCGARRSWALKGGRRRCARCRYDWTPGRLPLRLTRDRWRTLLTWFVRGAPSAQIAREMRMDRKRVLRALTIVRQTLQRVEGADTVDRSSTVVGLYAAHGAERLGAEILPDDAAALVRPLLRSRRDRPRIALPGPRHYIAVAHRGRLRRVGESSGSHAAFGQLEAFWAYLQRHLRGKGGIRRDRLGLYLAEYVWRYHHHHLSQTEQVRLLMAHLRAQRRGGANGTMP